MDQHKDIAARLARGPHDLGTYYLLDPAQASDLLDEWEDAQAMIVALEVALEQLEGAVEQPPA